MLRGEQTCPHFQKAPNFLKIPQNKLILRFVNFSRMSITVLFQKTRASFVPQFNFGGLSFDKKFGFQKMIFAKKIIFQKNLWATVFKVGGCAFRF